MPTAQAKTIADRDPLVRALGWRAVLLYHDPVAFDRWLWIRRRLLPGPVRTLDAGCGNGAFAMYAASVATGLPVGRPNCQSGGSHAAPPMSR